MPRISVNGASLYYEERGTGSTILCIHGTGSSVELWRDAAVELATRGRTLVYDRRGFSRSGPVERLAAGTDRHADDAAALIDALAAGPALVIGRSHGGEIAVDLALRYPEVVSALALLEGGGFSLSQAFMRWDAELVESVSAAAELDLSAAGETMLRGVLGDAAWPGLPDRVKEIFAANGAAILAELRGGILDVGAERLGAIGRPTLLVGATDSPPELKDMTRLMAEAMPSARVEWVEGGHLINPAHPAVLRFVEDVLATTGAAAKR